MSESASDGGDDVVQSRPLLEKVTEQIKQARFIVAKVDHERMNIYHELGFAMGANKDVLLVSEQEFRLPSDLSNWNCLTYPLGDHAALRSSIVKFFEDNYHRKVQALV